MKRLTSGSPRKQEEEEVVEEEVEDPEVVAYRKQEEEKAAALKKEQEEIEAFFEFPAVAEISKEWRHVVPYYQQSQTRKDDAAEKMSASREDSAGNVVESNISHRTDLKKNINYEIYTLKFSPPVRKLHDDSLICCRAIGEAEQDHRIDTQEAIVSDVLTASPDAKEKEEEKGSSVGKKSSTLSMSSSGMTGSQASWHKTDSGGSASAEQDLTTAHPSDALVQQAVARARETALYQEAQEKAEKSKRARRPEEDLGIFGMAAAAAAAVGDEMNQEVGTRDTRPLVLGGSLWNCGTERGPCG